MILTPCAAFADTANVALMLTVEAAPLDFTVTDSLSMHVTQGQTALTIDSLAVTNTGTEDLKVSSIAITPADGWSVEASSTDFEAAGKTALGFTCNGHDFSGGAYTLGDTLSAGSELTYTMSGQISANADLMSATQVASMVVTVEKAVNLISFNLDITADLPTPEYIYRTCQAEEGMTWEDWVNSEYSSDADLTYAIAGSYVNIHSNSFKYELDGLLQNANHGDYVNKTDIIIAENTYDCMIGLI